MASIKAILGKTSEQLFVEASQINCTYKSGINFVCFWITVTSQGMYEIV